MDVAPTKLQGKNSVSLFRQKQIHVICQRDIRTFFKKMFVKYFFVSNELASDAK